MRAHQLGVEPFELLHVQRTLHRDAEVIHERAQKALPEQEVGNRPPAEIRAEPERPHRLAAAAEKRPARKWVAPQMVVDYARQRHAPFRNWTWRILDDQQRIGI